jgi:hypothetical protein
MFGLGEGDGEGEGVPLALDALGDPSLDPEIVTSSFQLGASFFSWGELGKLAFLALSIRPCCGLPENLRVGAE